jgi:hypothetical protein
MSAAAIARISDPLGAHSGGSSSLGRTIGAGLGILAGLAAGAFLVATFPVLVGVGMVGGGLIGAAVIGLGAASMVTGAGALIGKAGRWLGGKIASMVSGGGGGGGGPACSSISGSASKTLAEGKLVARVTDKTTHNNAAVKGGVDKVFVEGLLVTRVGEPGTCGASRILSGASKTIVGGASVSSGAPDQEEDKSTFFDSWIDNLDTFSTYTGFARARPLRQRGVSRRLAGPRKSCGAGSAGCRGARGAGGRARGSTRLVS